MVMFCLGALVVLLCVFGFAPVFAAGMVGLSYLAWPIAIIGLLAAIADMRGRQRELDRAEREGLEAAARDARAASRPEVPA
jgi:hypothetical protein